MLRDHISFAVGTSRDRFEIIAFLCSLNRKFTRIDTLRQMGFLEENIRYLLKELSDYLQFRIIEKCSLAYPRRALCELVRVRSDYVKAIAVAVAELASRRHIALDEPHPLSLFDTDKRSEICLSEFPKCMRQVLPLRSQRDKLEFRKDCGFRLDELLMLQKKGRITNQDLVECLPVLDQAVLFSMLELSKQGYLAVPVSRITESVNRILGNLGEDIDLDTVSPSCQRLLNLNFLSLDKHRRIYRLRSRAEPEWLLSRLKNYFSQRAAIPKDSRNQI